MTLTYEPGQRFGRLTVVERDPVRHTQGASYFICRCDCGTVRSVRAVALKDGTTKSCGCYAREAVSARFLKHGHNVNYRVTPEYRAWQHMKDRCNNPNDQKFAEYGGRGIGICDKWQRSFEAFFSDMGQRPSAHHSLDRIDNDGNYEPGNVRWALVAVQNRNNRRTHLLTHDGITLPLKDWASRVGLSHETLRARLGRLHWNVARALETPAQANLSTVTSMANCMGVPPTDA